MLLGTLAVALAGCGGSPAASEDAASASPSARTSDLRPEGRWTLVAWTVKRSDLTVEQRMARTILGVFTPGCPSGPCDLTMAPGGSNGTFREAEAPVAEGSTPTTAAIDLTWDGRAYAGGSPERVTSCLTKEGTTVPEGYVQASSFSLSFVPKQGDAPSRVRGTVVHTAKGTPAGKAKGCTDFVETEAVGGVPTGSLDVKTPLSGRYDASMTTRSATPRSVAAVGSVLWLGAMSTAGTGSTQTITGLTGKPGPLTASSAGWSASPPATPNDCRAVSGTMVPKGADAQEVFDALHAVALTGDGKPIFAGTWKDRLNPNATGLSGACSLTAYEGRLLLVPEGAGP
ncbi:hypothetical protein GCM10022415_10600 [Knoellia locipacati]|uniref:Uncharacterized protein n=1 Tax=Knoellia locipacati TaxID=882824 RepID=A0A512SYH9_9MICO|nr:hypothetical protein [Knoellia locipacati]GEQ13011.1 hypothetical protein KLO01_10580 [Knoellia locipacati]